MFCQFIKFFWKNNSFSSPPQSFSEFRPLWWQKRRCLRLLMSESHWGLPGGTVSGNLPTNAGDTGSTSGLGRSHTPGSNKASMPQLPSPHSRTREPQLLSLCTDSPCSIREATAMRRACIQESSRLSPPTRESPRKATKTQESTKKKKKRTTWKL